MHAVSAAPYGSCIVFLLISYAYIRMLGNVGVKNATEYAILNANYMRARLQGQFEYFIQIIMVNVLMNLLLTCRPFKKSSRD